MNIGRGIGFCCISLIVVLSSCDRMHNVAYSQYESIGGEGWYPTDILGFSPVPSDSTLAPDTRYTVVLNVRYNPTCEAEVLPVLISEESADGEIDTRRFQIRMKDTKGRPIGKKGMVLYELSDTIRTNFSIPEGYWVEVMSMCPVDYSRGVTEVGVSLIKSL